MTELYTDTVTIVKAGTNARSEIEAKWNARKRVQIGTIELAAAAAGDKIVVATLPKGSILLPTSKIYFDALGTDSTLTVGVSGSWDLYAGSVSTSGAGNFECDAIAGIGEIMDEATDIVVSCVGDESYTGTLTSVIEYSWI